MTGTVAEYHYTNMKYFLMYSSNRQRRESPSLSGKCKQLMMYSIEVDWQGHQTCIITLVSKSLTSKGINLFISYSSHF